jgi:ketosteroid isomerase-like protein
MMEDIILLHEKDAMERWRQGDPCGFVALSADDITYFDPGLTKPIIGLEAFEDYMRQAEGKVNYQGSEFIDPRVVHVGDAALLSYNYRSSVISVPRMGHSAGGEVISQTPWNATEVYFRQDNHWRIVHTHWSFVNQRLPDLVGKCRCQFKRLLYLIEVCWQRSWLSNQQPWNAGVKVIPGDSLRSARQK